ncbi:MAG TPA: sensor histidine kinase, partial [Polyangiaceae bacterium]|nr:sensor histidine kinase [Polyangiaceae bacterium]
LPECRIDDRALQLAVINLIDNAIKYGKPGGEPTDAVVRITAEHADGTVAIRVRDQGPGIAPAERERIFERFVRGTKTADKDGVPVRGSGIGLALVKHIAESHGGTARVESVLGKGSTFVLTIPCAGHSEKAMAIDGKNAQDIV